MKKLHAPQDTDEPAKVVKQPRLDQFPEDFDEEEYIKKLEAKKHKEE